MHNKPIFQNGVSTNFLEIKIYLKTKKLTCEFEFTPQTSSKDHVETKQNSENDFENWSDALHFTIWQSVKSPNIKNIVKGYIIINIESGFQWKK